MARRENPSSILHKLLLLLAAVVFTIYMILYPPEL